MSRLNPTDRPRASPLSSHSPAQVVIMVDPSQEKLRRVSRGRERYEENLGVEVQNLIAAHPDLASAEGILSPSLAVSRGLEGSNFDRAVLNVTRPAATRLDLQLPGVDIVPTKRSNNVLPLSITHKRLSNGSRSEDNLQQGLGLTPRRDDKNTLSPSSTALKFLIRKTEAFIQNDDKEESRSEVQNGSLLAFQLPDHSAAILLSRRQNEGKKQEQAASVLRSGRHVGSKAAQRVIVQGLPLDRNAQVAFNPWNRGEIFVVDEVGRWTIFCIPRGLEDGSTYRSIVRQRGRIPGLRLPRPKDVQKSIERRHRRRRSTSLRRNVVRGELKTRSLSVPNLSPMSNRQDADSLDFADMRSESSRRVANFTQRTSTNSINGESTSNPLVPQRKRLRLDSRGAEIVPRLLPGHSLSGERLLTSSPSHGNSRWRELAILREREHGMVTPPVSQNVLSTSQSGALATHEPGFLTSSNKLMSPPETQEKVISLGTASSLEDKSKAPRSRAITTSSVATLTSPKSGRDVEQERVWSLASRGQYSRNLQGDIDLSKLEPEPAHLDLGFRLGSREDVIQMPPPYLIHDSTDGNSSNVESKEEQVGFEDDPTRSEESIPTVRRSSRLKPAVKSNFVTTMQDAHIEKLSAIRGQKHPLQRARASTAPPVRDSKQMQTYNQEILDSTWYKLSSGLHKRLGLESSASLALSMLAGQPSTEGWNQLGSAARAKVLFEACQSEKDSIDIHMHSSKISLKDSEQGSGNHESLMVDDKLTSLSSSFALTDSYVASLNYDTPPIETAADDWHQSKLWEHLDSQHVRQDQAIQNVLSSSTSQHSLVLETASRHDANNNGSVSEQDPAYVSDHIKEQVAILESLNIPALSRAAKLNNLEGTSLKSVTGMDIDSLEDQSRTPQPLPHMSQNDIATDSAMDMAERSNGQDEISTTHFDNHTATAWVTGVSGVGGRSQHSMLKPAFRVGNLAAMSDVAQPLLSAQYDGWLRAEWILNEKSIVLYTRQDGYFLDLNTKEWSSVPEVINPEPRMRSMYLELRSCQHHRDHYFVLTTRQVSLVQVCTVKDADNDKEHLTGRIAASSQHFRGASDTTLAMNIIAKNGGYWVVIYSWSNPMVTCIRFHMASHRCTEARASVPMLLTRSDLMNGLATPVKISRPLQAIDWSKSTSILRRGNRHRDQSIERPLPSELALSLGLSNVDDNPELSQPKKWSRKGKTTQFSTASSTRRQGDLANDGKTNPSALRSFHQPARGKYGASGIASLPSMGRNCLKPLVNAIVSDRSDLTGRHNDKDVSTDALSHVPIDQVKRAQTLLQYFSMLKGSNNTCSSHMPRQTINRLRGQLERKAIEGVPAFDTYIHTIRLPTKHKARKLFCTSYADLIYSLHSTFSSRKSGESSPSKPVKKIARSLAFDVMLASLPLSNSWLENTHGAQSSSPNGPGISNIGRNNPNAKEHNNHSRSSSTEPYGINASRQPTPTIFSMPTPIDRAYSSSPSTGRRSRHGTSTPDPQLGFPRVILQDVYERLGKVVEVDVQASRTVVDLETSFIIGQWDDNLGVGFGSME